MIIKSEDVYITPEVLGYGSYSVVYAAQYCGKQCVVKKIRPSNEKSHKSLNKELKVLLTLKHPCIIQLLGVFFTSDNPQSPELLMERMKMNLTETLNIKKSFHFKISVLHDVACGLCYIHKKGIIHCDLTGNNILLTEKCNAKIADFGQAIIYDQEYDKGLPTAPGNEAHMPPESFKPNPVYSTKLDVFSFGCVIIHTVTQEFPIPDNKYVETLEPGKYKEISETDRRSKLIKILKCNPDIVGLYEMVLNCLQDNPRNRPDMEEVLLQLKDSLQKFNVLSENTTLQHCQSTTVKDGHSSTQKLIDELETDKTIFKAERISLQAERESLQEERKILQAERESFLIEKQLLQLEKYKKSKKSKQKRNKNQYKVYKLKLLSSRSQNIKSYHVRQVVEDTDHKPQESLSTVVNPGMCTFSTIINTLSPYTINILQSLLLPHILLLIVLGGIKSLIYKWYVIYKSMPKIASCEKDAVSCCHYCH